jgi:uncharacterized protein
MDELLHAFNPWWDGTFAFPGIPREPYLELIDKLGSAPGVVFITGLRRVGKTTLMHQYIHHLLKNIDPRRILYVSLDNLIFQHHTLPEIIREYRQIHDLKQREGVHVFLDEVHYLKDFELELKNLYDLGGVNIYASGSASLDITMRSPHLTGRQRIMRVHPLSFREFLQFTDKQISMADQHLYENAALEYVKTGGLPEYVQTRDPNVLQSIIDSVLYRDILARSQIRNRESLKSVLMMLAQSVSTSISISRFSRVLNMKSDTVRRILDLFLESNLVGVVERHGKFSERQLSPRKYYLADTGFFSILTEGINLGAVVENLVFLTLSRSVNPRYYRAHTREVDFICKKHAIESKYKRILSDDDLLNIVQLKGMESRTIITDSRKGNDQGIDLVPLWKFLLDNDRPSEIFPSPPLTP